MEPAKNIFSHRKYWAKRFGTAPVLPMSRAEMDQLGWDSCDIILVTGDAYIDHPSFGMALIGRLLEAQGFRVGIIAQPDWHSPAAFKALGKPNLFYGVTAGNMDSMVNRYTADRKIRSDDAYTPNAEGNKRPDRAVIVYSQRCREAYADVPVVIGGIEASLRRIAHFDYWSDKVRRSILPDSKADILLYGNAERALVELAHRLAKGEPIASIADLRGTAILLKGIPEGRHVIDSTSVDTPGKMAAHINPYADTSAAACATEGETQTVQFHPPKKEADRTQGVVRLPSFEQVRDDPVLYAHANRVLHLETNPGNARVLVQAHGDRDVWINPPPIPLTTEEMDGVFDLPYNRRPHPAYGEAKIPAYEMIRFSVNIMRGCFGGCTFCSITEHEGRIIQNRSEASILHEVEEIRDKTPGFTGIISDLGGPTANMYRLKCRDPKIESACRRLVLRLPGHLREHGHRPRPADPALPQGANAARHQENPDRLGRALRPRGEVAGIRQGTGQPPCRRLSQDRAGAHRRRAAVEDDEARHGRLLQVQGAVREVFQRSRQGTVPDPLLHLRPPRHHRRGHAGTGAMAQGQRLPPGPGAELHPHADGDRLRHVSHRQEPAAQGQPRKAKKYRSRKAAGPGGCTRPSCATTTPKTGRCLREALKQMGRADLIGSSKKHLVPAWQPVGTGTHAGGTTAARRPAKAPPAPSTLWTDLDPPAVPSKTHLPARKKITSAYCRMDFFALDFNTIC